MMNVVENSKKGKAVGLDEVTAEITQWRLYTPGVLK